MIVRELFTRLGFKTDTSGAKTYSAALVTVKKSVLGLVGAVTGGITAVAAFTVAMGISGNQLAKTARMANTSIKELDGFTFAVERLTLLSKGEATGALLQFENGLRQASFGGRDFVTSFRRLGFGLEEIRNRTVSANDVMARLQVLAKDNTQEALALHVASQIFGSGLANQIIPALRESNQQFSESVALAGTLGTTLSEAGGKHAERLVDGLHNVKRIIATLSIQVAERLIPPFADFIDKGTEFFEANKDLIDSGIDKFFERLGVVVKGFATFAKGSFTAGQELVSMLGGLSRILNLIVVGLIILTAIGVVKFFTGAAAAALKFNKALWKLFFNPALLPMLALVLVLEDLVTWLTGGESAIGKFFGEFEHLKEGIKDTRKELAGFLSQAKEIAGLGSLVIKAVFDLDKKALDESLGKFKSALTQMVTELGNYVIETVDAMIRHATGGEGDPSKGIRLSDLDLGLFDAIKDFLQIDSNAPSPLSRLGVSSSPNSGVLDSIQRSVVNTTRRITSSVNLTTDFNLAVSADDKSFTDKFKQFQSSTEKMVYDARSAAIRQSLQDAQAVD